jgi:gluconate 2-dehydrogenase gamma chain
MPTQTDNDQLKSLMFFTKEEAATVEAITARLIPGTPDNPGAREAHAVVFIDRALAGYVAHLQVFYRRGIAALDGLAAERHEKPFRRLAEDRQDAILREIEGSKELEQPGRMAQFFAVVYEHTLEGTFCDPKYGGNKDALGWRMIGFPGAHWGYAPEQMQLGLDSRTIAVSTLADIEAHASASPGGAS